MGPHRYRYRHDANTWGGLLNFKTSIQTYTHTDVPTERYVYICTHTYICIKYKYKYKCKYKYRCKYKYKYKYKYTNKYKYRYKYSYIYVYKYSYIYMYVYKCKCKCKCTYIHTYMHHIHTYYGNGCSGMAFICFFVRFFLRMSVQKTMRNSIYLRSSTSRFHQHIFLGEPSICRYSSRCVMQILQKCEESTNT